MAVTPAIYHVVATVGVDAAGKPFFRATRGLSQRSGDTTLVGNDLTVTLTTPIALNESVTEVGPYNGVLATSLENPTPPADKRTIRWHGDISGGAMASLVIFDMRGAVERKPLPVVSVHE